MGDCIPLESAVVRRIMRVLDARGAWYIKTTGVSKVGCPDIIACYKGQFVAIEVKRPGGTTTRKQDHELRSIAGADGYACIAYSELQVEDLLDLVDTGAS